MKRVIQASLAVFVTSVTMSSLAFGAESADGTKVSCTGETMQVVRRANGQTNELEKSQPATVIVKGNPQVANAEVTLDTNYKGTKKRRFGIEVSLAFTDGHTEKQIKLSSVIGGYQVSTESQITSAAEVNMKIGGLSVQCRID